MKTNEDIFDEQVIFTEKKYSFVKGNRNNFIFILACNCIRRGLQEKDIKELIIGKYRSKGFPPKEIEPTIEVAFEKSRSEFGKYAPKVIDTGKPLESLLSKTSSEKDFDLFIKHKPFPLGFKRITSLNKQQKADSYLLSRGIRNKDCQRFYIGVTDIIPSLKHYVVFLVEVKYNKCAGFVARLIDDNINEPKYKNSYDAEFDKLLYGFEEVITTPTNTLIIVEGIFDKQRVDVVLNLDIKSDIKCCATFGKKISQKQINRIKNVGVKNIVIIYDKDAIDKLKHYSVELEKYFNVLVANSYDKDLGEMNRDEVLRIFDSLQSPKKYFIDKIPYKM